MKNLVYLSPVPWASFAQRPHKFVEWFHSITGGDVLWIDPYPTRFPRISDLRRIGSSASYTRPKNPEWIRVLRPMALPLEPVLGSEWINAVFWRPVLNEVVLFSTIRDTFFVIGKPSLFALALLNVQKNVRTVYDAMDSFSSFYSGFTRRAVQRRERELVQRVDELWVTSTRLKQRWIALKPQLKLVLNALDPSLLPPPWPSPDQKARDKGSKIFGYVGTIADWFDWEWVVSLAAVRTNDLIRLIGPVFRKPKMELPRNIEFLPECSHAVALGAMRSFDVGLIPFMRTELTESVDPIKFYEYRALGLPVLSTDFGEMTFRDGAPGIFISKNLGDLAEVAVSALSHVDDVESARSFAADNSWAARFGAAKLVP